MASAARPKRSAEDFTRTHSSGQPSKKPRFDVRNPSALAPDELEDDAVLEADVIGARGQQVRRNAVNIDGYDSDSDNENFDERAANKAKAEKKSKDEEQDDMFADLEEDFKDGGDEDGDADRRGGRKKAVRFLDEDEIEGQVKSSKSGGHVSADFHLSDKGKQTEEVESSSDSEVDDEVRASAGDLDDELGAGGKKTHAPKVDAFNMQNEQDEGRFDDQGNFVRKAADPDAIHDLWMEGISKKDMKAAKDAAEKREEERRQRNLQDDSKSNPDILATLIPLLEKGETILEALARLGKGKSKDKKPKWQAKKNKKQNGANGDADMSEKDPAETKRRQNVEAITAAADLLLTRGQVEIYDAERELLIRQYNREVDKQWRDPSPESERDEEKSWEYKWTDGRDGGNINGPYDSNTMRSWSNAGYFGEGVVFRQVGDTNDNSWSRILPI